MFEEFGHADPQHAVKYGGAGLGLAVVKRLVEAMEGAVGLDSTPGEGETFWYEAPFPVTESAPRENDAGDPTRGRRFAVGVRA